MDDRRWLVVLLVGVAGVNLWFGHAFPTPPHSSHDAFLTIPQFQRLFLGFQPQDSGFGMFHPTWFVEGEGNPLDGLARFFSNNRARHWTQLPHPMGAAAAVAAVVPSWGAVQLVFTGYLLLLLGGLYAIGCHVHSSRAGLLAAVVAAGSPGLFGFSRYRECHLPVAAMGVLVVWLLLASDGLRRRGVCLALSVATWSLMRSGEGAADLVGAGLVVVGPALITAAQAVRRDGRGALVGLALVLVPLALLTEWDQVHGAVLQVLTAFRDPTVQLDLGASQGALAGAGSFRWAYLILVGTDYLAPLLAGCFAVSLIFLRGTEPAHKWLWAAWFFVPFLAFTWMQRKASWYAVGLVPPLALVVGVAAASRPWLARVAAGVALFQLVVFSSTSEASWPEGLRWIRQPVPLADWRLRRVDLLRPGEDAGTLAVARDTRALLKWLDRHWEPGAIRYVGYLPMGYRHDYAFRYLAGLRRPDLQFLNLSDPRLREAGYAGVSADKIDLLLRLDGGFQAWPPGPKELAWLGKNVGCQAGDLLDPFLARVLAGNWVQRGDPGVPFYERVRQGEPLAPGVICGG
jgi:hypothetical protein